MPSSFAVDLGKAAAWGCTVAGQTLTCPQLVVEKGATAVVEVGFTPTSVSAAETISMAVSSDTPEVSPDVRPNTAQTSLPVFGSEPAVSGTVTGPGGVAVAGAVVSLRAPSDTWIPSYKTTTSAAGTYAFATVNAGPYNVVVTPPQASGLAGASVSTTSDGTTPIGVDVALVAGAQISGTISAGGVPKSGVSVSLLQSGAWSSLMETQTAVDGTYSFTGVPAGAYYVRVFPTAPLMNQTQSLSVVAGQQATGVNFALVSNAGMSGTVRDAAGNGLAGVTVMAYRPTDRYVGAGSTTTQAGGSYSFASLNLAPGTYYLMFRPPSGSGLSTIWYADVALRSAAAPISLNSGETAGGLDAHFGYGGISGKVTGPGGGAMGGAKVSVYRPTDAFVPMVQVTTRADGTYEAPGLPPGSYKVLFTPVSGLGLSPKWWNDSTTRAAATDITITAASGGVSGVSATFGP